MGSWRVSESRPPAPSERLVALGTAEECLAALGTSWLGLSLEEVERRRSRSGPNALPRVPGPPLGRRLLAQFTHRMALLLWFGAFLAAVAGLPPLVGAIVAVNLINGFFSFWQEYRAQRATEVLERLLPRFCRVRRDDREQRIAAEDVVAGDILLLREGENICADARVLWQTDLCVDQSVLTGESRPVSRTAVPGDPGLAWIEQPNLVFAGSIVSSGSAGAVAFATGGATEFGRLARLTQSLAQTPSPLQLELARLTHTVTSLVLGIGLAFFGLAVGLAGMDPGQGFLFAVGMIVAFVPEGLLPTVTLSLAMGVQRMASRHALVKRLSAVETLGCTNVICTDKTGTLTQNQMTVRALYVMGRLVRVGGVGYEPVGDFFEGEQRLEAPDSLVGELLSAASLCNDARLLPPDAENPRWAVLGDPTEGALLTVAVKAGLEPERLALENPRLAEVPFESRRKRMTTLHKCGRGGRILVKGAPREVLDLCRLGPEEREAADLVNDEMARDGLRVLAVACRDLEPAPVEFRPDELETELRLLGLVGMHDPPRPEVSDAVSLCHQAGVRILMITGDYGLTAESVARRIGIVRGCSPRLVGGAELEAMSPAELEDLLGRDEEMIFARVAPEQKLQIVAALQARGQVVAVTGDGVNDAPALRQADIGVAMGMSGSDVAREAAAIVLTDDSFASIVYAIEEGRAVYANLGRFVSYIFTSNFAEAVPFVLFAFSQGRIPLALTLMQILAIDLGTDMLPALALGVEPPEPGLMERPPRDRRRPLVGPGLLGRVAFLGSVASLGMLVSFVLGYWLHGGWGQPGPLAGSGPGYALATTMAFATVVIAQVGNVLAHRTELGSALALPRARNPWIGWGIAVELGFLLVLVYVPWLHPVFGTAAMGPQDWACVLVWMPSLLLADEIRKALLRAWRRHENLEIPDRRLRPGRGRPGPGPLSAGP